MSELDITINRLPALTWNRLRMNEVNMTIPEDGCAGQLEIEKPEDIVLEEGKQPERFAEVPTGMGEDAGRALKSAKSAYHTLISDHQEAQPVRMHFAFGQESQVRQWVGIEAKANAAVTVIMDFKAAGEAAEQDGLGLIQTKILAEENALVRLVQIHRAGDRWTILNDTGSLCGKNARVEIVHVVLSGANNLIGSRTELMGEGASLKTDIGYKVEGDHRLDMNYIANHYGRHTNCDIDCLGVLRDQAFKLFRGTIDFKKGAKASLGNEKEDVLLMDEGVINQTIPLILCAEEDVEGNHGATIGQLSEESMFYLKSRGMSEESILAMVEKGRLKSIIKRIPDEQTVSELLEAVGE